MEGRFYHLYQSLQSESSYDETPKSKFFLLCPIEIDVKEQMGTYKILGINLGANTRI